MDPANNRARERSLRGLERELEEERTQNYPPPRNGGSRGYPLWVRVRAMHVLRMTNDYDMAAECVGCHPISIRRWEERLIPYRMNGGRERRSITAADQLLLSICLYIYPDASLDEICIFIIANGGDVYTRPLISKRCSDLGLTRKRSSREAYEAFSPSSIRRRLWFWSEPPPLGIIGVPTSSMIDVDETGFYLKDISNKHGRSHTTVRVRHTAHYTRSEPRLNVIVAVEPGNHNVHPLSSGSINLPRRWVYITQDTVDQFNFGEFINDILTDLENNPVPDGYDDRRCILWDNLSAHKTPYVTNLIRDRQTPNNFYSVDRPPYQPKIAPIEYVICELAGELAKRCQRS